MKNNKRDLMARLEAVVAHNRMNGNLDDFNNEEVLAEAWIKVAEGKVKEEGNLQFAIDKAIRELRQQSGESKPSIYPIQLRNENEGPDHREPRPTIDDADRVYATLAPWDEIVFRHYVDTGCNHEAVAERFEMTVTEACDAIIRIREQLSKEVLYNAN